MNSNPAALIHPPIFMMQGTQFLWSLYFAVLMGAVTPPLRGPASGPCPRQTMEDHLSISTNGFFWEPFRVIIV